MNGIPTNTQSDKLKGAVKGALYGFGSAWVLGVIGLLLCLTGIGAIVGIPMIIIAFLAPFLGAFSGLMDIKGECPYCGYKISSNPSFPGLDCPACKKRVVIKDKKFHVVE